MQGADDDDGGGGGGGGGGSGAERERLNEGTLRWELRELKG